MNAPAINDTDARTLEMLARSPVAAEALKRHEAERAAQRAAILAKLEADEALAREELSATAERAVLARNDVASAQAALQAAALQLRRTEIDETTASTHLEALGNRARWTLSDLGGDVIERTLGSVLGAQRRVAGALDYRQMSDPYGTPLPPVLTDAHAPPRVARLRELAAELERLRLAPDAPAVIEARCAAIAAWLDEGMKLEPEARPGLLARVFGA